MIKLKKKRRGIEDRIVPVGEVPDGLTMLVYGRAGTGKTAFGATFPRPLLVLDVKEKGTETIRSEKDVDVLSIDSWQDFEEAYWYLESGDTKYQSVQIDQITQLQNLGMDKIRADKGMKPEDVFSQRQWGQLGGLMTTWLYNYRELVSKSINIIFIAHERESKTEGEDDERIDPNIGPRLTPSSASFINGAVSTIGNTFILERFEKDEKTKKRTRIVEYCMRIGPHSVYTAKIRKPKDAEGVPDYIVDPTYDKIMAISRGASKVKKVRRL